MRTLIGWTFSGILPEVSVDPMKVVQDAVLEFTDKKDLFLAYMSSMLVGGPGEKEKWCVTDSKDTKLQTHSNCETCMYNVRRRPFWYCGSLCYHCKLLWPSQITEKKLVSIN